MVRGFEEGIRLHVMIEFQEEIAQADRREQ